MKQLYAIKMFEAMGRGIVANYRIITGETVASCEILVLNELDTVIINTTDLKHYTFKYSETRDCLVLGDGEIFNHADVPNVSYSLETIGDRKLMVFKALKDIEAGEQLFIDYSADTMVDTAEYLKNKSLID